MFSMSGVLPRRHRVSTATRSSVAPARASSRWCRSRRFGCSARIWSPTSSPQRRVASLAGVAADAMTRAVEGFTGLEHALEPVGRGRRRTVRQRLEGDQHRGRAPRHRELRSTGVVVILGGRFKGGDFARSASSRWRSAGGRSSRSAKRAAHPRRARRAIAGARGGGHGGGGADGVRVSGAGTDGACSRRPARASTCSATTRSADGCSNRKCGGCRRNGTARVSSEQSSVRLVR